MQPNHRLKSARINAGWTQEDVADLLHISAMSIYRWERGETTPNVSLRDRLCRLFRLSAQELGWQEEVAPLRPKGRAPFLVDPSLPGGNHLSLLGQKVLLKDMVSAQHAVIGVVGLPGSGKTALVRALAEQADLCQHVDGVLWASCGQETEPLRHLRRWLAFLGEKEHAATIEEAQDHLRLLLRGRTMLIILDDLWRAEDLLPFRLGANCRSVLTTRLPVIANTLCDRMFHPHHLSEPQAFHLLSNGLSSMLVREHRSVLRALCKQMGNLPLALEQSGKYLRREARTHSPRRFHDALSQLFQPEVYLRLRIPPDSCSLDLAMKRSEAWLEASARHTFSRLASCFPAAPATFTEQQIAERFAPGSFLRDLDQLVDVGLLSMIAKSHYQMHPVIATYARFAEQLSIASLEKDR